MGNVLEILLDGDFAKNFKQMDDNLANIEQHTKETSERMKELVQSLDKLGGTLNGSVNTGLEKLSSGFDRLNEAISKMGLNSKSSLETTANETNKFINELNRLINGTESKKKSGEKSILDGLLFDTKELEDKRNKFAALISELESKAVSKGGRLFDTNQLISTGGTDAMKRLNVIIDNLRASIKNTQADLENTTKKFYGGGAEFKYKELEKVEMAYARLTTRITDLRGKLQTATSLQPIIQELNSIRTEYNQVTSDLNTFVQKNKKLQDAEKNIKAYTDRIAEIENAFKRLTLSGGAFTKNGSMTKEAKALTDEKTMLEERIRLMRMTTDEAIKNEQRITAETEKQNAAKLAEFQKLYAERIALEKKSGAAETNRQLRDKQNLATDNEVRLLEVYSSRMREIDSIIKDLSKKYPELAKKAKEAYDIKSVEASVKEEIRRAAALERTEKAQARLNEQNAKKNANDFNAKLGITEDPKTIEQYRIAIANLRKEIQKTTMDEAGAKTRSTLTKRMEEYKKKLQEVESEQKKVASSAKGMEISLQKIASAFGIYFSVQSLVNFGRKIVEITGEFELQHRALQAIIGDTQEANRLFDKTVALAVKSPYRIKDLITYTKQLAAYRIETDKLYETNKMLADISSGLGVDMGRLILAFGQVKAANYLRGQELRQFSEAGVNILGELSKYFEELEGRAVSTGEVFDRVSKRMVSFEDVEVVLKRLTEEGGIFFNMQEIQSETLRGKIMNLRDSFDLMLDSIGSQNRGVFMWLVESIKSITDNWTTFSQVLRVVIGLFAAYKVVQISAAASMLKAGTAASAEELGLRRLSARLAEFTAGTNAATAANLRLANSMKAASKSGIVVAALVAVLEIVKAIVNVQRQRNELEREFSKINSESARQSSMMVSQYKEMAEKIRNTSTSEEERVKTMEKMKRMYGEILPQRLLDIEYIAKEGNTYKEAEDRIASYYALKRREAEIEKTEAEYGTKLDDAESKAAQRIQRQIENVHGVTVEITSITSAINKANQMIASGEITWTQWKEAFESLLELETGVRLYEKDWIGASMFDDGIISKVAKLNQAVDDYNKAMRDATGRTENFSESASESIEKIFEKGRSLAEVDFYKAVDSGEQQDEVKSKMEFIGKNAAKYFKLAFNISLNEGGGFFSGLKTDAQKNAYFNLFDQMLDAEAARMKMTKAQETISSKIDEIVGKFSLNANQRSLFAELVIGSEESNSEYFDRAKRKLEGWLSDIHDMETGMHERISADSTDLVNAKPAIELFLEFIKMLAGDNKTGGGRNGNPALERLNKQISAIKEANKQYEKYLELVDDTNAFEKVKNEFSGLFEELGMQEWVDSVNSFSDADVKDAFEDKLKPSVVAAGKKGREAAKKYATEWQYQIDKTRFDFLMDDAKKQIEGMFDSLDMGKELEKLGIGKDFAKSIFDVDSVEFDDIRQKLEELKSGLFGVEGFNGDALTKWYDEVTEKINDAEDKAQKERLKKYVEYMKLAMNERAKIMYEGLAEAAEIEKTFDKEIAKANADNDEVRLKALQDAKTAALQGSKEKTDTALQKQAFEDFKGGELYVRIFNDIDKASTTVLDLMKRKLTEIRDSMHDLAPTELKAINSEIEKINSQLSQRSPFDALKRSFNDAMSLMEGDTFGSRLRDLFFTDETEGNIGLGIASDQDAIDGLEKELAALEAIYQMKEKGQEVSVFGLSEDENMKQYAGYAMLSAESLQKLINSKKDDLNATKEHQRELINDSDTIQQFRKDLDAYAKAWSSMAQSVNSAISSFMDNLDAFGIESNGTTDALKDLFGSLGGIVAQIPMFVAALAAANLELTSTMGVIGLVAMGVEALIAVVSAIAKIRNAGADRIIDEMSDKVDKLEKNAEKLEKAFDAAFSIERLTAYNRELQSTMQKEIEAYNAMINAEYSKKNPDRDQIDEWQKTIRSLQDQIKEQQENFIEELGGVGESGFKDAASEFVDAWYEAFKETGDGLAGLQDNFNEMLLNIVKKQSILRVTERFLDQLFRQIDEYLEDGSITTYEMDALRAAAESKFPELNEWLKTFFESFGNLGEAAESNLTGLKKGIQGVTEEESEIIAAYMNAIRFYSIDSNTQLISIAAVITDNSGQLNPMLVELRNIAHRTDDIYSFLYQRRENGTDSIRVSIVS